MYKENNMKYLVRWVVVASVVSAIGGCATITSGDGQSVTFDSDPKEAVVYINDVNVGVTPLVIPVKRSNDTKVRIEKDGYESKEFVMTTGTNGMFWGNILLGGFVGSSTDTSTGAMYQYSPGQYYVSLPAVGEGSE